MAKSETDSTRTPADGNEHISKASTQATRHTTPVKSPNTTLSSAVKGAPVSKSSEEKPSSTVKANETVKSALGAGVPGAPQPASETKSSSALASSHSSGLSQQSKNAIIAASVIGGILVFALLIYAIWRRPRKGASHSNFTCLRRRSDTITIATTHDERMTALPIYHETRYSVHSSRIGSQLSLGLNRKRPSGVPAVVAQRFHKDNPWIQASWKSQSPPTPTNESHPLNQVLLSPPSPPSSKLGMVRVYSSHADTSQKSKNGSQDTTKSCSAVAIQERSEESPPIGSTSGLPQQPLEASNQDRWSWTNPEAPPTPKMAASSRRSSLSSLPKYKRVKSWVRGQADRQGIRIDEETPPSNRRTSAPAFKNKASKPNLAPSKPERKLTKRKKSDGGSSFNALRPYPDISTINAPAPAKVAHNNRPRTAPHDEADDLTISYS